VYAAPRVFLRSWNPTRANAIAINIQSTYTLLRFRLLYAKIVPMAEQRNNSVSEKKGAKRSRFVKLLWLTAGFLLVGIGMVGIIVPGLPTTPFMILAAACFARSSQRFYRWVLTNRLFGAQVRRFREGKGISLRGKVFSVSAMSLFILLSVIFFIPNHLLWVKALALILGIIGVTYIVTRPTDSSNNSHPIQ
jgi:uncharacterized membrane protein YbaN (DUF454 family)